MEDKKQICPYCGGAGRYCPVPEYSPFDYRNCYACKGTGYVDKRPAKKSEDKKEQFKEMIRRNPDVF